MEVCLLACTGGGTTVVPIDSRAFARVPIVAGFPHDPVSCHVDQLRPTKVYGLHVVCQGAA